MGVAVAALPPATNIPFPNATALHRVSIDSELGTSLQLIPSYENMSEFVVSPPATQTPLPTPDAAVMAALLAPLVLLRIWSAGAYAMVRTLVIIVVALVIAVHRIPFCENARQLVPVPPATQMRPFGEIAVLV
jgi:hypothetical protein